MNPVKYAHSRPLKFTFADQLIALYFEWHWKMDSYLKCPVLIVKWWQKIVPYFFQQILTNISLIYAKTVIKYAF